MEINLSQKEIGFCKVNTSDIMMWKPDATERDIADKMHPPPLGMVHNYLF